MFSIFKNYPNLVAEMSEKADGDMKIYPDGMRNGSEAMSSREKYFSKIGIGAKDVVSAEIVHSEKVSQVGVEDKNKTIKGADALISKEKGVFLLVTTADCLPIFVFDSLSLALGLIHAGWRGLAQNIISEAVEKMREEFGSDPKNILVGIGPGICASCYEVGGEVAEKFKNYRECVRKKAGRTYLDLKKIAETQLLEQGILPENIEISPDCTYEGVKEYFSYRRDKPKEVQAMLAVIGLKG